MISENPLIVTSVLLLLPLVPAAIIYVLLSPRNRDGQKKSDEAKGSYEGQFMKFGKLKVEFSVFGSSATYIILLSAAYYIHHETESESTKRSSVQDQQAWLVEIPVGLTDLNDRPIPADNGEMQQVRVELEPSLTVASANALQFWVVPNNGRFPTVRFSIPQLSVRAELLDLNSSNLVQHDYSAKKMVGIQPVWIKTGPAYEH